MQSNDFKGKEVVNNRETGRTVFFGQQENGQFYGEIRDVYGDLQASALRRTQPEIVDWFSYQGIENENIRWGENSNLNNDGRNLLNENNEKEDTIWNVVVKRDGEYVKFSKKSMVFSDAEDVLKDLKKSGIESVDMESAEIVDNDELKGYMKESHILEDSKKVIKSFDYIIGKLNALTVSLSREGEHTLEGTIETMYQRIKKLRDKYVLKSKNTKEEVQQDEKYYKHISNKWNGFDN